MHVEGSGHCHEHCSRAEWLTKIPKAFKLRWWQATDYGRREPPAELVAELQTFIHPETAHATISSIHPCTRMDNNTIP